MPRPFDHAVLASRDLAAQKALFERIGFQVGARNRHPWGTENHIVQFANSFVELIATGADFHAAADPDPHLYSFAGFIHDYLEAREGFAMLALHTGNAQFDHDAFKYEGIGDFDPFHFERHGRMPDGTPAPVGFTLAFARATAMPHAGFFTCQHHAPANFWNADFQRHANGVVAMTGAILVARQPSAHAAFLANFTDQREPAVQDGRMVFALSDQQALEIMTPADFVAGHGADALPADLPDGAFAALRLGVHDLARTERCLAGAGVAVSRHGGRLIVPPREVFGVALVFGE